MKIILESLLRKFQPHRLEETVLEIIQVPHDGTGIKRSQTALAAKIVHSRLGKLKCRQRGDRRGKQSFFTLGENARLTTGPDGIKQRFAPEVLLKVGKAIVTYLKHLRHSKPLVAETAAHRDKPPVLLHVGTDYANNRRRAEKAKIPSVRPRGRKSLHSRRSHAVTPHIQFFQNLFFHNRQMECFGTKIAIFAPKCK